MLQTPFTNPAGGIRLSNSVLFSSTKWWVVPSGTPAAWAMAPDATCTDFQTLVDASSISPVAGFHQLRRPHHQRHRANAIEATMRRPSLYPVGSLWPDQLVTRGPPYRCLPSMLPCLRHHASSGCCGSVNFIRSLLRPVTESSYRLRTSGPKSSHRRSRDHRDLDARTKGTFPRCTPATRSGM